MDCPACSRDVPEGKAFCGHCGARVHGGGPESADAPALTPRRRFAPRIVALVAPLVASAALFFALLLGLIKVTPYQDEVWRLPLWLERGWNGLADWQTQRGVGSPTQVPSLPPTQEPGLGIASFPEELFGPTPAITPTAELCAEPLSDGQVLGAEAFEGDRLAVRLQRSSGFTAPSYYGRIEPLDGEATFGASTCGGSPDAALPYQLACFGINPLVAAGEALDASPREARFTLYPAGQDCPVLEGQVRLPDVPHADASAACAEAFGDEGRVYAVGYPQAGEMMVTLEGPRDFQASEYLAELDWYGDQLYTPQAYTCTVLAQYPRRLYCLGPTLVPPEMPFASIVIQPLDGVCAGGLFDGTFGVPVVPVVAKEGESGSNTCEGSLNSQEACEACGGQWRHGFAGDFCLRSGPP